MISNKNTIKFRFYTILGISQELMPYFLSHLPQFPLMNKMSLIIKLIICIKMNTDILPADAKLEILEKLDKDMDSFSIASLCISNKSWYDACSLVNWKKYYERQFGKNNSINDYRMEYMKKSNNIGNISNMYKVFLCINYNKEYSTDIVEDWLVEYYKLLNIGIESYKDIYIRENISLSKDAINIIPSGYKNTLWQLCFELSSDNSLSVYDLEGNVIIVNKNKDDLKELGIVDVSTDLNIFETIESNDPPIQMFAFEKYGTIYRTVDFNDGEDITSEINVL